MTIPDRTLAAATLKCAEALRALSHGDPSASLDHLSAACAIIRDAREAAILAQPWAGPRLIGEVLPVALAQMVNSRKV